MGDTQGTKEVPMPWRAASPMDQRTQFIADFLRDALSITELCALYGVSRKTGYKWIDRYLRHGPAGLEERSRRPRRAESDVRRDRGRDLGRSAPPPDLGW
jgi:transposase-like protein